MSSQRRFEGPVLEDLLEQVRAESGDGARIVAANRVRRGGLGGFFAKEHFEVVVEPTDDVAGSPAAAPTPPRSRTATAARPTRPRRGTAAPTTPTASPAGREPDTRDMPVSVLDLVDATNDDERRHNMVDLARAERGAAADTPRVSTQTEGFQAILERLAGGLDATDRDDARDTTTRPDATLPRGLAPSGDDIEVVDAFDDVAVLDDAVDVAEAIIVDDVAPPPLATTMVDDAIVTAARVPAVAPEEPVPATPTARSNATGPGTIAAPRSPRRSALAPSVLERPENALARLGVPPKFVPRGMPAERLHGALVESLAALPAPDTVPDAQGVVIAIVGIGSRPVVLARALAEEHGFDPDNVVVAAPHDLGERIPSWLQICDPETADERRRSWRRREHATFVAVSITGLGTSTDWARTMLDRLEPTQVWAIASAATKPEDVEAWTERLGGVDALALERLDDTISPAAVLRLPIPVGRLDGAPATALRWADLLLDRMAMQ